MFNSGGAVKFFYIIDVDEEKMVRVGVKGVGEMRIFVLEKFKFCNVNGENMEFEYEECMVKV